MQYDSTSSDAAGLYGDVCSGVAHGVIPSDFKRTLLHLVSPTALGKNF